MGLLNSLFSGFQNAFGGLGNALGGLFGGGGAKNTGAQGMFDAMGGPNQYMGGYNKSNVSKAGQGNQAGMNPGMLGLGAGMMALPQLFGGKTKAPDFNTPDMQAMRNFTTNPPALPQGMQDSINKSLAVQEEQQNRNLMNIYESAKPGFDARTDSAFLRDQANLQRSQQENRANALMGPTLQYQQPLQQGLAGMAGASQENQYLQAAMKASQQQQQKNMWSGLGSMFVNKGLYPSGMGGIMDIFNPRGK